VPHDKVSDPKSVNIDILNGEEINHARNRDRSFVGFAGENWTNSASKSSETNRGRPRCRACKEES
jgi:hypothetical protein